MKLLIFVASLTLCAPALAFKSKAFYGGVGYFSQNSLNRVANKPSGDAGFLGTSMYALNLKYDIGISYDWYLAGRFSITPIARESAGDSAKNTMMHFYFPIGQNFADRGFSGWEWFVGPGLIRYTIQGKGGTTVLSNGTGTATFGLPGKSATVQNVTLNTGLAWNLENSRFGLDVIVEGAMSDKRSEDLMLTYDYRFGGGF